MEDVLIVLKSIFDKVMDIILFFPRKIARHFYRYNQQKIKLKMQTELIRRYKRTLRDISQKCDELKGVQYNGNTSIPLNIIKEIAITNITIPIDDTKVSRTTN